MSRLKGEIAALDRAATVLAAVNTPPAASVQRGMATPTDWRREMRQQEEVRARSRAAARAANPRPTRPPRWYVRCSDCLSVAAVDAGAPPRDATCACGGKIESMGKVTRFGRLHVATREETPCDDRCTGAQGPKCDCPCSGENHGSGRVVEIEVTTGVPRIVMLDIAQSQARAAEYRAALAEATASVESRHGRGRVAGEAKLAGSWIGTDEYGTMRQYHYALASVRRAKALRTHKGRLRALAAITGGKDY